MDVEIGTEATQFPEKEYIYGIFLAVCPLQTILLSDLVGCNADSNVCFSHLFYTFEARQTAIIVYSWLLYLTQQVQIPKKCAK